MRAAWGHLEQAVPPEWELGHVELDLLTGVWTLTARPHPRRRTIPSRWHVTGVGRGELEALRDLAAKLREWIGR